MNERKKIIIQTGTNPDESLPTPHFDAEATLTARPVVPLSEQDAFQKQAGGYGHRPVKPFWKRPALLALIVLVAAGVGVAAGLAIGVYRNRNAAPTPVVNTPAASEENANVSLPVEQQPPTRQARASVPESAQVTPPVEPKVEERERTDERADRRNEPKRDGADDVAAPPQPVARDKKRDKNDGDDESVVFDDRQTERERRRDERRDRRRRQRDEEQAVDIPRRVERVEQGVNRIREIFEGRQP
jgi:hypothetical protein